MSTVHHRKPPSKSSLPAPKAHVNPSWGRFNVGTWSVTLGCGAIVAFCPILVIIYVIALFHFSGSLISTLSAIVSHGPLEFTLLYAPRFSAPALAGYAAWVLFQVFLYAFLPGQIGYGQRTPAGHLLPYRVNGLAAWATTHILYGGAVYMGVLDPAIIAKNWQGLVVAFNVYGYLLAAVAYVKAHVAPTHQDDLKFSGSIVYDYYMGIELNPRIGDWFDFKLFHNGRPGIVAWTLINLSFMAYQKELHGYITNSMIVVNILHGFYVVDFFFNEDWYLRTIDICHDHYGFYLAWGSMVWLPTMYTLQSQYLALYPSSLSTLTTSILLFTGIASYIVFRSINHQKDLSRRTSGNCVIWGKPAEFITARYTTEDGKEHQSILLCSGWWGVVRHANYTADLVLSYCGCAAAGWGGKGWTILPWTYAIFMTVLLVQRCVRDEDRCGKKYGKTWEEYCGRVRYRLLPGVW
ncbi:ergosterol biosynthesis ERG4/ERG24 [Trichophaea hybrida]|nr:ergosterol biosynthesis ERG4/ERG24 [Trichophaea hybrida]